MSALILPQLRVRSGYTFRDCYGDIDDVVGALKDLQTPFAALVDGKGTWGHVRFHATAKKAGIKVGLGMEFPVRNEGDFKPVSWMLAKDTRKFYNQTTKIVQEGVTANDVADFTGVIRFAGNGLTDNPDSFDYIDLCPESPLAIMKAVELHRYTGKPLALTSANIMPKREHRRYAAAWECRLGVSPEWILSGDELRDFMLQFVDKELVDSAIENTFLVAEAVGDLDLPQAPLIHLEGDLRAACREGQASRLSRGHIKEWTQIYEDRLIEELEQIQLKAFDSYFNVVSDLVKYAKQHMLVGPARGSSAGSLVCYLLDITEVDPLVHNLLFARFIDVSRADLPDIDIDFPDTKRHMVFEYLQQKYGKEYVSKMGNLSTLQPASVMACVGKRFAVPQSELQGIRNAMIEYSSGDQRYGHGLEDTLKTTSPGQRFSESRPIETDCLANLELHPSHTGVHAAAILVCNDKISDYCTVNSEGVAQIDKKDSEKLNLLKIDALGLRTLGIIEDTGVATNDFLYGLPLTDSAAFDIINSGKVSDIFQFSGRALQMVAKAVNVDSFKQIDHITALARPGPLSSGMLELYVNKASGNSPIEYVVPQLEEHLGATYGVVLYQEQVMQIVRLIGQFDWVQTSAVRKAMSGRKGEEFFNKQKIDFVRGAKEAHNLPEEVSGKIWDEICTFGSWAFNASHSVSYAVISYWCCWLKAHHPLEWAAANLRAAKDETQTIEILREMKREGIEYTAFDPALSVANWAVRDGKLVGGVMNIKGVGPVKALRFLEDRDAGLVDAKYIAKLVSKGIEFCDLAEAHTLWGHLYDCPSLAGVRGEPIKQIAEVGDKEEAVFICKLKKKILASENEPHRVKKRGGKLYKGDPEFLDMHVVDDSVSSVMNLRIRPENFKVFGRAIYEEAPKDSWWLVRGWKLKDISMFIVKKMKRLDVDG